MKKIIIIVAVGLCLYGITSWFFPFSPFLFKPQIGYTSTEKQVDEYTQLYHSVENAGGIIQSIGYNIGQGWAMEGEKADISIRDLFIIEI